MKIRTENAKVLHQLQLKGAQRDKLHNVLSEGERRIISLAAFLADVTDRPGSAPFILMTLFHLWTTNLSGKLLNASLNSLNRVR